MYGKKIKITLPSNSTALLNIETGESSKVPSNESILVSYKGTLLKFATRDYRQVKVWDKNLKESKRNDPAFFETGFIRRR